MALNTSCILIELHEAWWLFAQCIFAFNLASCRYAAISQPTDNPLWYYSIELSLANLRIHKYCAKQVIKAVDEG